MQKAIVVVGSINLDLVVSADRIPHAGETIIGTGFNSFHGGKGANQAVAAAKLGHPVFMIGNVGEDAFGPQLRAALAESGVDTSCVATVPGPSGVALITIGEHGENNIVVVPGANGLLTPEQLEKALPILQRAAFVLAQLEIPFETVEYLAVLTERLGVPWMLDPAPARELPTALLGRVTWLTPNETEARGLLAAQISAGEQDSDVAIADELLALGPKNVVLKLGNRGCVIAQAAQSKERVPAFLVDAVDTTAAGDAFNAAFAVGLVRGQTASQSAVFASAVAAISVTRQGAQPSMPTAVELNEFLACTRAIHSA
jgi:ribokinase